MLKASYARFQQGHRTIGYPEQPPTLPDRYRGRPVFEPSKCKTGCRDCAQVCPTGALEAGDGRINLDLGRCLFCADCAAACPEQALVFSQDHRLAVRAQRDLITRGQEIKLAQALDARSRKLFGHSLKLRQVSAGGCNACEAEVNVLSTVVFDLGRFGIQVVASPRHADGLLITGPVPQNMKSALLQTYEATPDPKLVIAVGACAIAGGPYAGHAEIHGGADGLVPVDLYVPGCPPHPLTILDGLLRLLGRLDERR